MLKIDYAALALFFAFLFALAKIKKLFIQTKGIFLADFTSPKLAIGS